MRQTDAPEVPNRSEQGSERGSEPAPLTLAEAARLVGVSERAIRKRAERGTLQTSTAVRGGKLVAVVERADLARLFPGAMPENPKDQGEPQGRTPSEPPAPPASFTRAAVELERLERQASGGASTEELATLREQLNQAREQLANLRGQLEMSAKVEAAAQRAADKLEARLDAARRETLSLAHQLGMVEGDRDRLRRQLEAPRGWFARLLGR